MDYIGPLGFLTKSLSIADTLKPYIRFDDIKRNNNDIIVLLIKINLIAIQVCYNEEKLKIKKKKPL